MLSSFNSVINKFGCQPQYNFKHAQDCENFTIINEKRRYTNCVDEENVTRVCQLSQRHALHLAGLVY